MLILHSFFTLPFIFFFSSSSLLILGIYFSVIIFREVEKFISSLFSYFLFSLSFSSFFYGVCVCVCGFWWWLKLLSTFFFLPSPFSFLHPHLITFSCYHPYSCSVNMISILKIFVYSSLSSQPLMDHNVDSLPIHFVFIFIYLIFG